MPGLEFAQVKPTRVSVDGSVFDVRVVARQAQAIRVNRQYAPRLGPIGARAVLAMQQVSGCDVVRLKGDAALLVGRLRCANDKVPIPASRTVRGSLDCYAIESFVSAATGELITHYDCDIVNAGFAP